MSRRRQSAKLNRVSSTYINYLEHLKTNHPKIYNSNREMVDTLLQEFKPRQ